MNKVDAPFLKENSYPGSHHLLTHPTHELYHGGESVCQARFWNIFTEWIHASLSAITNEQVDIYIYTYIYIYITNNLL